MTTKVKTVPHTQGPFHTDPECNHETVLGPDGILVADCSIFTIDHKRPAEVNQANARLMVSAPDGEALAREIQMTHIPNPSTGSIIVPVSVLKNALKLLATIAGGQAS